MPSRRYRHLGMGCNTYLLPVLATDKLPYSFFAVTSHAINEQASPRIGESAAATRFCLFHISVNVAGSTADEIMTPCHCVRLHDKVRKQVPYHHQVQITHGYANVYFALVAAILGQSFRPTVETSRKCSEEDSVYYDKCMSHIDQHLARSLRVEISLIDIICEYTANGDVF